MEKHFVLKIRKNRNSKIFGNAQNRMELRLHRFEVRSGLLIWILDLFRNETIKKIL